MQPHQTQRAQILGSDLAKREVDESVTEDAAMSVPTVGGDACEVDRHDSDEEQFSARLERQKGQMDSQASSHTIGSVVPAANGDVQPQDTPEGQLALKQFFDSLVGWQARLMAGVSDLDRLEAFVQRLARMRHAMFYLSPSIAKRMEDFHVLREQLISGLEQSPLRVIGKLQNGELVPMQGPLAKRKTKRLSASALERQKRWQRDTNRERREHMQTEWWWFTFPLAQSVRDLAELAERFGFNAAEAPAVANALWRRPMSPPREETMAHAEMLAHLVPRLLHALSQAKPTTPRGPRVPLDVRALLVAQKFSKAQIAWTLKMVADEVGTRSSVLLNKYSNGKRKGQPKYPMICKFWNDEQMERAARKLARKTE